jgi:DNA-binding NarL/FixJ family response regulator
MIGVLVVDDQALIRDSFRLILELEADLEVVGEAADGREAVALAGQLQPDVVLMDIRMPVLDGLAATSELRRSGLRTHVLILTTYDADEYLYDALQAGASGFLLKDASREQLAAAVRTVAAGEALLAPAITRRLIEDFCHRPPPSAAIPPAAEELSTRELEVLRQLAQGRSNAEIAAELFLSEATVKSHVARMLAKLGLRDKAATQANRTGTKAGATPPRAGDPSMSRRRP